MIALTVLVFGLVGLMQLFAAAILSNLVARSNTFATQAAQQVAEDLKAQYSTWLQSARSGGNVPGHPFRLEGSVSVNVADPNVAPMVNQTSSSRVNVTTVNLNRLNAKVLFGGHHHKHIKSVVASL